MKRFAVLALFVLTVALAAAQTTIVPDVRGLIAKSDLAGAERLANQYRAEKGNTPEALVALSWVGRGLLAAGDNDKAATIATQTHKLALEVLKTRALDADKVLPIALGAAIETEAKALAATGQRASAVAYLREQGAKYKTASIYSRLQKNLHLLSLEGQPAPAFTTKTVLGSPMPATKGKPVLLFFWAHWCPDCKVQGPIVAEIQKKYKEKGLVVMGPTRPYGYVARGAEAGPEQELQYIDEIRKQVYGSIEMAVPVSLDDALAWGMDSTPTLVLVDQAGKVAMFHPGNMKLEELESRIQALLSRS
jgi:thiol-disulfide isomerase/thioredoxin